jgi:hypothetical protein
VPSRALLVVPALVALAAARPVVACTFGCNPPQGDVAAIPLPEAPTPNFASLHYDPRTGEAIVVLGDSRPVGVYIFSEQGHLDPTVTALARLGEDLPSQADTRNLGWFSANGLLTPGIHSLGKILPVGLSGREVNDQFEFWVLGISCWGTCGPIYPLAIPEPATAVLMALACLSLVRLPR